MNGEDRGPEPEEKSKRPVCTDLRDQGAQGVTGEGQTGDGPVQRLVRILSLTLGSSLPFSPDPPTSSQFRLLLATSRPTQPPF